MTTRKVLSTPLSNDKAVTVAIDALLEDSPGLALRRVQEVVHGTTVVTNAILERRGAHFALVATGFPGCAGTPPGEDAAPLQTFLAQAPAQSSGASGSRSANAWLLCPCGFNGRDYRAITGEVTIDGPVTARLWTASGRSPPSTILDCARSVHNDRSFNIATVSGA